MSQSMVLDENEDFMEYDPYEDDLWHRYSSTFFLDREKAFKGACEGYYQLLMEESRLAALYGKSRGFDQAFLEEDSPEPCLDEYSHFTYWDFIYGLSDGLTGKREQNYFVSHNLVSPIERAKIDLATMGYTLEVFQLQPFQILLRW